MVCVIRIITWVQDFCLFIYSYLGRDVCPSVDNIKNCIDGLDDAGNNGLNQRSPAVSRILFSFLVSFARIFHHWLIYFMFIEH